MAAESPHVRERAEVDYFALETRTALNRESTGRMPFAWTINPYRGCEFGCKYCYARYTHEFMELRNGYDFESKIYAKVNSPEVLREELAKAKDKGLPIALGTATDPYQPAEKQFEITRRMLQAIAALSGMEFAITTKSVLLLRDLDLFKEINARHRFSIHMTVTTLDEHLARLLEPKATPPAKRMEAVAHLARAGIRVSVNAMPILPGLTDSYDSLDALARSAEDAGADSIHGNVLFLKPSAMAQFMPFLREQFPELVSRYRRLYARSAYLEGEYKERLAALISELRKKYRLEGGREGRHPLPSAQLKLW